MAPESPQLLQTEPSEQTPSLSQAIDRARQKLLSQQHPDGYWCGELEGDTSLESDTIKFWRFLGRVNPEREKQLASRLLDQQLPDGGWPIYAGGPGEINASVKAYFALRLSGHPVTSPVLQKARTQILKLGGLGKVNSFEKFYLAMFGVSIGG